MSRKYTPHRAGKRWRENAPEWVLDCFLDPSCPLDPYTILLGGSMLNGTVDGKEVWIDYWSTCGMGLLTPVQASAYRYANGHHRVKWMDLPDEVRREVTRRVEEP